MVPHAIYSANSKNPSLLLSAAMSSSLKQATSPISPLGDFGIRHINPSVIFLDLVRLTTSALPRPAPKSYSYDFIFAHELKKMSDAPLIVAAKLTQDLSAVRDRNVARARVSWARVEVLGSTLERRCEARTPSGMDVSSWKVNVL